MTNQTEEFLKAMHKETEYQTIPGEHLELEKLHALLCEKYTFEAGDIIEWKPGLKNKNTPYGKPLIVTKIYNEPILSDKDSGTQYYREPLDMVCGEIMGDELLEFHYDSRRFQPYSQRDKADG